MYEIDKLSYLHIGQQGENQSVTIELDMTSWADEHPDASFAILFKPYNEDQPSPVYTTYDEPVLTWVVGSSVTQNVGVGYTEIRAFSAGGLIKKSKVIPTSVEYSVSGGSSVTPPAYADWVNNVLAAAVDAEDAKDSAEAAQTAAESSAAQARSDVNEVKPVISTITQEAHNMLSIMPTWITNTEVAVNGDEITVTSLKSTTALNAFFFVDVSQESSVTISWAGYTGTGSGAIRIGRMDSAGNYIEWIGGYITRLDAETDDVGGTYTMNVTDESYIGIALYSVRSTNAGIGNYITYKQVQVVSGSTTKPYVPHLSAIDSFARGYVSELDETVSDLSDSTDDLNNAVTGLGETVDKLSEDALCNNILARIMSSLIENGSSEVPSGMLRIGSINNSNGNTDTTITYRACTRQIAKIPFEISVSCDSDHYLDVFYYEEGVYQSHTGWYRKVTILPEKEFRILVRDYPEDTSVAGNVDLLAESLAIENTKYYPGTGSNIYTGNRISLRPDFTKNNRCSIALWKDFVNTLEEHRLCDNQSIAVFGKYMFIFLEAGGCDILDMETKEIIAQAETLSTNNHQNSAQFTDLYYDQDDEFPLLLVSRYMKNTGTNNDGCLVYRVTRSESVFTMTLITTILWDHTTYGVDWCMDSKTKTLYGIAFLNGDYTVTQNNPSHVVGFGFPSADDLRTNQTITLTDDDIKSSFTIEHQIVQGCTMHNGVIYVAYVLNDESAAVKCFVGAVDVDSQQIVSKIPLLVRLECEGVAIQDGTMYVSQRRGSDSGTENPLKIYSIDFD